MSVKPYKRNFIQRLFGKPQTGSPLNPDCWTFADGQLTIDLAKTPELTENGGGVRFEDARLPKRILVIRGDDGVIRAYLDECKHGGRRLDPVPGAGVICCCSVGKSTYDYEGKVLSGSATENATVLPAEERDGRVVVKVD